jgi:hypothetical protein
MSDQKDVHIASLPEGLPEGSEQVWGVRYKSGLPIIPRNSREEAEFEIASLGGEVMVRYVTPWVPVSDVGAGTSRSL